MKRVWTVKNKFLTNLLRLVGNADRTPTDGHTKVRNYYYSY
jgi:hypothetical protein